MVTNPEKSFGASADRPNMPRRVPSTSNSGGSKAAVISLAEIPSSYPRLAASTNARYPTGCPVSTEKNATSMSDATSLAGVRSLTHHDNATCAVGSSSYDDSADEEDASSSSVASPRSSSPPSLLLDITSLSLNAASSPLSCAIPRSLSTISRVNSVNLQFIRMMASPGVGLLFPRPFLPAPSSSDIENRRSSSILFNVNPSSAARCVAAMYFSIPFASGSSVSGFALALESATVHALSSDGFTFSASIQNNVNVTIANALANASCSLVPMRITLDSPMSAASIRASDTVALRVSLRAHSAHRRTNS